MNPLNGTPDDIIAAMAADIPDIRAVLRQVRAIVEPSSRAIAEYQAAALYALARPYNHPGARVLEIGTAQGYSAAVLASALPDATLITLNPHEAEAALARKSLVQFGDRLTVVEQKSADYLASYTGPEFDLIFIDGDHKNVRLDLPWYAHLRVGGLMLFHDFSPSGTYRACPPVYRALLEFKLDLGREFDALIVDDGGVGMAGFIKQTDDNLDTAVRDALALAHSTSSASYSYLVGLYQLAQQAQGVEGCLVECGCQNGGSAAALALGLGEGRKVWLFDNFTGVPMPEPEDGEKAMQRFEANPDGWAKGDKETAREAMKTAGVKGAHIVEGDFAETFTNPKHRTGPIAVLHVDATLYASTELALERFYGDVVKGGLVIVSAFHHWPGVQLAVHEVFGDDQVAFNRLEKGIWWIK